MKHITLLVSFALIGFNAIAQYQVGEVVDIDGIKTIVFYSDDEHTYAISLWNQDKGVKQKYKTELEEGLYLPYSNIEYAHDIYSEVGKYGRANQDIVEKYCQDNSLDICEAFPLFGWANKLGDDWFIPGDRELELFAQFCGNGFGEDAYKGNRDAQKEFAQIQKTLPKKYSLPMVIRGSSMTKIGEGYNNNLSYYVMGGNGGTFNFGPSNWWVHESGFGNSIIKISLIFPYSFPVAVVKL